METTELVSMDQHGKSSIMLASNTGIIINLLQLKQTDNALVHVQNTDSILLPQSVLTKYPQLKTS